MRLRAAALAITLGVGCAKPPAGATLDAGAKGEAGPAAAKVAPAGSPRPGMAWVPPGKFRAGTPPERLPRIAEEELPGTEIAMGGFYMDLFPFPNEAGAIPTTNTSRADAARLCESKGKRLCTELEWERACKGPESTTYEYGDAYRAVACGTGVPAEQSAKQPSGERLACASAFGVRDLHGGVWEWTSSAWGRGSTNADLGVLRGGNAAAGELVGRCANAIGRPASAKASSMGFRCCAGASNEAKVDLAQLTGPVLERSARPSELAAPLAPLVKGAWFAKTDGGPSAFARAWTWHPVANEELVIAGGCGKSGASLDCGAVIARVGASPKVIVEIPTGLDFPDVAQFGDARHLRVRGLELRGGFLRDIVYTYGFVDVAEKKN